MTRFGELTRKVDAFFARVADRHGTDMQCSTGCSDCCHVRLSITGVEAAAIRDLVAAWPLPERRTLAESGSDGPGSPSRDRCAALDPAGRCKIYEARPLVCRSHGVPIRLRRGALPVVQACHHNFRHTAPDPDCVLDQATLSAMLLAVDRAAPPLAAAANRGLAPVVDRTAPPLAAAANRGLAPVVDRTARVGAGSPARSGPSDPATRPGATGEPGPRVDLAALLAELAAI